MHKEDQDYNIYCHKNSIKGKSLKNTSPQQWKTIETELCRLKPVLSTSRNQI